jgi:hypothetical protein
VKENELIKKQRCILTDIRKAKASWICLAWSCLRSGVSQLLYHISHQVPRQMGLKHEIGTQHMLCPMQVQQCVCRKGAVTEHNKTSDASPY